MQNRELQDYYKTKLNQLNMPLNQIMKMKTQNKIGKMKHLIAFLMLLVAWLTAFTINAQEYKVKFNSNTDRKLKLNLFNSEVKIEGYDGNEVVIQAKGFEAPPKRADGLKPLSSTGVDNTGIGLSIDNTMTINKVSRSDVDYYIKVPRKVDVVFEETNWGGSNAIEIKDIEGEVEVSTKTSDIKIENVSGPVVANTTSGDITIVYAAVSASKPSSISNISGFVDITVPSSAKANFKISTISGEVYSNIDIATTSKSNGIPRVGGNNISGTYNGGGAEINVNDISGDIFIRKGK
jgi:hypothetical protein